MNIKKLVTITVLTISSLFGATSIESSINNTDMFLNQKRQFKKIEEKKDTKIIHYDTKKPTLIKDKSEKCFKTIKIIDTSITLLTKKEKNTIFKKYINQCNTITNLKNLVNEITSIYIDRGYVTSKAYLKPQNISKGIIEISMVEGVLENFTDNSSSIKTAFFNQEGKFLNLRDLEVGIENLNRLKSNNAKLQLIPGTKTGQTKVKIENQTSNRINGYFSLNNYGQETTGKKQLGMNLNIDNILNINDIFTINYNTTDNHNTAENSVGDTYSYSFPIGRSLYSFQYSNSKYKQMLKAQLNEYKIIGKSQTYNVTVKYHWFHNQNHRFSNSIFINHYKTEKHIDNSLIETSTYNLSKAGISFDYIYQSNTFQSFLSFEYTKGIHLIDDLNPTELDERYKKYTVDINFIKSFNPFQYSLDFHLQHTKDQLFGINQLSIGGPYSVRGYKEESIDGNRGYYYRNELTYNYPKKIFNYFRTSYYIALDGGWIKKEEDTSGGRLLGEAIGMKWNSKDFLFDTYYSKALRTNDVSKNKNFFALQLVYKF